MNSTLALCTIQKTNKSRVQITDWPSTTSLCCWHCCHGFQTCPLPLAIGYEARLDKFVVQGVFCSWACSKAYLLSTSSLDVNTVSQLQNLFCKRVTGVLEHIKAAPPRCTLKMFGGELGIDEFRSAGRDGKSIQLFPKNMVIISPNVVETENAGKQMRKETPCEVNFQGASGNNEALRLKRNKPLKNSKNTLEKSMGFTSACAPSMGLSSFTGPVK